MTDPATPLWSLAPNWREPYSVSYEFRTDIFTSRSGKEQRRALRTSPRKQVQFTVTRTEEDARRFNSFLWRYQGPLIAMADLSRHAEILDGAAPGERHLTVDDASVPWMMPGSLVILASRSNYARALVSAINGNVVTLLDAVTREWMPGDKVHPQFNGKVDDSISIKNYGQRTIEAQISFSVDPGSSGSQDDAGFVEDVFNHREVFVISPNFAQPISGDFTRKADTVDFSSGRIQTYLPIGFGTRTKQYQMLSASQQDRARLLAMFLRAKGRRGEFYVPSYEDDFKLLAPAPDGTLTAMFAGTNVAEVYQADDAHRAVMIETSRGDRFYRVITGATVNSGNSVVTTDTGWPTMLDSTVNINWLMVNRFAVDQLSVNCITDEVSQIQFSFTSLEDRPVVAPDSIFGNIAGDALWVIANWGIPLAEQIFDRIDFLINTEYAYTTTSIGMFGVDVAQNTDKLINSYVNTVRKVNLL